MAHQTLKAALHESIFRSSLHAKAIADRVGVSYQTLHEFADETRDTNIPVRRLIALLGAIDNLSVLHYLAGLAHCVVFHVPQSGAASSTAQAVREFGEWLHVHATALDDGALSADDLDRIETVGNHAIASIASAIDDARRRVYAKHDRPAAEPRVDAHLARVR